jgi:hypothetical protein
MSQMMKRAVLLVAATLVLSGFAFSQYRDGDEDDGGYYQQGNGAQARQYGYQNGYRDGLSKGQHEGEENDPYDYREPSWREATRGYERWMGPVQAFQNGYRDGYQTGFRAGYARVNRGWGDGDRDDRGYNGGYYPNAGYPYGGYGNGTYYPAGRFGSPAYQIGYQDGAQVGREDNASRKPFNPNPRGRYDDEDHGYSSRYGSKRAYQAQYANGYRAGYQSVRRY